VIEKSIPLVEQIIAENSIALGKDLEGYKNHVYRMVNYSLAPREATEDERLKIVIAGCFHDLGLWTAGTFDYLPPSAKLAGDYLKRSGLTDWTSEIGLMITQHHKLGIFAGSELVECFRKGDLVDLSLGFIRCGVSAEFIRLARSEFPNSGFHKRILSTAGRWICRHPLDPLPILKW
jgi:hypothetical protein